MVKTYPSRIMPALKHIKGPKVLDIGCVGMGKNDVLGGLDFIFGELSKKYEVTGLDINKEGADKMNKEGYKVVAQDAQEPYDLNQKFDTVVSEENIEHIANLKTYLDNIRKHLKDDGVLVLSTPNSSCLDFMLQMFLFGKPQVNHYHTHVHTLETITYLLESNGFKVTHHEYIQAVEKGMNFNSKIIGFIIRFFPARFGRTMILVAKKGEKNV